MSGFINNGVPELSVVDEAGLMNIDTQYAAGQNPESASLSMLRLSTMMTFLQNYANHTPVSGTRYYRKFTLGSQVQLTGIEYLIGTVGGTDKVIVELHDSTGALVATSDTTGVTVGTLGTWQQVPFKPGGTGTAAPQTFAAGVYYIALQFNGTTARFDTYNAPGLALPVGSATGVFGTGASITPPTTYTADLGPVVNPY